MSFKIFCPLLLWTTVCLSSAAVVDFNKMIPGKSTSCSYLDIEGDQDNSYTYEGRVCCMCGKGRKFVDHCNVSNPSSTRCDPCEYDDNDPSKRTHIEFEPHLEETCVKKKKSDCRHGKEYFGGSITEADGCRCPDGMVEDTNGVGCHSVAGTGKPELQDFSSTSKPSTSGAKTNLIGRINASAETTVPTETSKSNPPNQDQPLTITHLLPLIIVIGVVVILIILGLVIFFVCCHPAGNSGYKRGRSPESTPDPQHNTNVAVTESSSTVSTDGSNPSLMPSSRNGRKSTHTTGNGWRQPPIRMTDSPSIRSTSANTYSDQVVVDLASEAIRETPSQDDSRHIVCESSLNATHHNNLSSSSGVENAADMPEVIQRPVISIEEANSLINVHEAKVIAKAFARRFGCEGHRRYVLRLMRDIVENEDKTIPDENVTFDDLDNKYKTDTPEFCVQCMRHAIAVKGNELTAKYLLKKVENLGMKTYENIVIEEINKILGTRPPPGRFVMKLR